MTTCECVHLVIGSYFRSRKKMAVTPFDRL